ncbi:MAG: hypothetical protein GC159_06725 [Phycisphaera sp.]|nr:hypothetical protein [Phycisphaera sp.]
MNAIWKMATKRIKVKESRVVSWLCVGFFVASAVCLVASFWGSLFGPEVLDLLGALGFFITVIAFLTSGSEAVRDYIAKRPRGLAPDWLRPWRWFLIVSAIVLAAIVIASGIPMFLYADGVASSSGPVFEHRAVYELCNHGTYTTVSRWRYLVVGTSFIVGWHGGIAFMDLIGLIYLLFGVKRSMNTKNSTEGGAT